jgi:hypothetical protein
MTDLGETTERHATRVAKDQRLSQQEAMFAFDFMKLSFADLLWAPSVTPLLSHAFAGAGEDDADEAEIAQAAGAASAKMMPLCVFCSSGLALTALSGSARRSDQRGADHSIASVAGLSLCECSAQLGAALSDTCTAEERTLMGKKRKISEK